MQMNGNGFCYPNKPYVSGDTMNHPDEDVRDALIKLSDALCQWERSTGCESVIIVRERGFCYRALNGKPDVNDDIPDQQLIDMIPR